MKFLIIILMLVFSQLLIASEIKYIQSDKLQIYGQGKSNILQIMHYDRMMGIEPTNKITIEFNLDKVTAIIIHDMNAENNKCGKKQKREIYYVVFLEPEKNVKRIRTMINGPCLVDRDAILRLRVSTVGEKYYENTITLESSHRYIDGE